MKISDIRIRVCQTDHSMMADSEMRAGGASSFDFLLVSMTTDEGIEGHSFGFAGRGARMAGEIARQTMKPFFPGKDPLARERHYQEFRTYDRWWNHVPIHTYGPFHICLWDIAGKAAGVPLYRLLGEYRQKVPVYASSFVLDGPEAYARQALAVKERGWHGYTVHPPGDFDLDLEIYRVCREAVGSGFKLMADPVCAYGHQQALRMGRHLEKLDYYWIEEPLHDTDFHELRRLAAALDIPVRGTEVLPGNHYAIAECISAGVVDIVRSDVSSKHGVTPVRKTAHLAESSGMNCELHTTIYHPLEIMNLHCCRAMSNCECFELLYPMEYMNFGMLAPLNIDAEGYAHAPETPGAGFDPDWDFIENATVEQF
ncbi:MAG: L-rhamnonate dehydratase [Bryobacteraceae bacterium]|nr:L-rhamnonate dehydratase [Bryobacteraceae bacterium]